MMHVFIPKIHLDGRGTYLETWRQTDLDLKFVQSSLSVSRPYVLRGLHYQLKHPQAKLMRVVQGSAIVAAVDLRSSGKPRTEILDDINHRAVLVPSGWAVGFLSMERGATMSYMLTDYHYPDDDFAVDALDPDIGIAWPKYDYMRSQRDKLARRLCDVPPGELPG